MTAELRAKLKKGDRRALAKTITLLESKLGSERTAAAGLLREFSDYKAESLRIGVCGSPGVGKSTFIDVLGCSLVESGHNVAVLAVDPSSPVSGGSILGDKTRMDKLSQSTRAYIRPSPGGGVPGGITANTHEVMQVLEYAGFDFVILETIGIGQSETDVALLVDTLLYLHQPESGDDLQAIKKGILEVSDLFIVTKADGPLKISAEFAAHQIKGVVNDPHASENRVYCVSSTEGTGFNEIHDFLVKQIKNTAFIESRRKAQERPLFENRIMNDFKALLSEDAGIKAKLTAILNARGNKKSLRECSEEFLREVTKT